MGREAARRARISVGPCATDRRGREDRARSEDQVGTWCEILSEENPAMADAIGKNIYLRQAQIGPMANFVYLIGDPATRKLAVVDPAWDVETIRKFADSEAYQIDKILITHYHPDHLSGSSMAPRTRGHSTTLLTAKSHCQRTP